MNDCLFVSPHPDDAVFSSGGLIACLVRRGHAVRVATVFSRGPDEAARMREDADAVAQLGAELVPLGFTDLVARAPIGSHRFDLAPTDAPLIDELGAVLRHIRAGATVIGPLGVARHPDHQIAFAACAALAGEVAFYEDVPYALCPHATARRLRQLGLVAPRRAPWVERAAIMRWWLERPVLREVVTPALLPLAAWMAAGGPRLGATPIALVEERHEVSATLPAKMDAIARYATQWPRFYRTLGDFRRALAGHARRLGAPFIVERIFRRP